MTHYIFVYGTLKQGHGNNRILGDSEFLGAAVTCEDYFSMYDGSFPYVTKDGHFHIKGELFAVTSEKVLRRLDMLEGVPHHYERVPITARLGDATECIPCEMYVATKHTAEQVKKYHPIIVPNDNNTLEWKR